METPTLQVNIDKLRTEVAPYSDRKQGVRSIPFSLNNIFSSPKIYMVLPIVVLVLLIFGSPDFIKYDHANNKGEVSRKVAYKKLFTTWLILSAVLIIGLFGYNYRLTKVET